MLLIVTANISGDDPVRLTPSSKVMDAKTGDRIPDGGGHGGPDLGQIELRFDKQQIDPALDQPGAPEREKPLPELPGSTSPKGLTKCPEGPISPATNKGRPNRSVSSSATARACRAMAALKATGSISGGNLKDEPPKVAVSRISAPASA